MGAPFFVCNSFADLIECFEELMLNTRAAEDSCSAESSRNPRPKVGFGWEHYVGKQRRKKHCVVVADSWKDRSTFAVVHIVPVVA